VTSSPTRTLHRHTETTFDPDRCHGATGAYRLPSGPRHPYGFDADHCRQTRDDSSRCELRGPIPARLLEGEGLTTRNRIICRITEEFFAAALTLRCELHRDHLGRYTVTTENDFSTRPMSQRNRRLSIPFVAQSFQSEVANNSNR
jgi:hypothetical protein